MTINETYRRVDKYLASDRHSAIIVDVPNAMVLKEFKSHYNVDANQIKNASDFAKPDSLPLMSDLKAFLEASNDRMFLDGLAFFLWLLGKEALKKELKSILELQTEGKLVIITYCCADILHTLDNRLFQAARITIVDGDKVDLPTLQFLSPVIPEPEAYVDGINQLNSMDAFLEGGFDIIPVVTKRHKADYPDSAYEITDISSSYDALCYLTDIEKLGEDAGEPEEWDELLKQMSNYDTWEDFVSQKFGVPSKLATFIRDFKSLDKFDRWALFIALRTFGAKGNNYLSEVVSKSSTFGEFINECFTHLLDYEVKDSAFWSLYNERRQILIGMQEFTDTAASFCKQVHCKGEASLCYMTDLSTIEKETTIALIAMYRQSYSERELQEVLRHTYLDLALYLEPFDFGVRELNDYIEQYKFCKVTNQISSEFKEKVDYQATEHQYITWLQPRSVLVDKLEKDKDKTCLYFMDAMGVEFLGFLQHKCYANRLNFKAAVGRCDLPSITSINKGFSDEFRAIGCKVYDKKDLDELKHSGNSSYNYENTKIPIHIVEELNILNKLIGQLNTMGKDQTAYVIADHGATRLAVINETENKWEVSEKGIHSGRCCPQSDTTEKPDFAVEENGFWCLANYDRFKGGRKALVEVHGGATIEEVAVPVITIQKQDKQILCKLVDDKPVMVSFKKKAELVLFVEVQSDSLTITINEMKYKVEPTGTPYQYHVVMPDIKKAGVYQFNVYDNGALICKDLKFEVKKEGASERKFF